MSYYRLYYMTAFSGHIEGFEEFDADHDPGAEALARTKQGAHVLELWSGHRKVLRLEALDLASQLLAERRARKSVKAQVEPATDSDEDSESQNRSA